MTRTRRTVAALVASAALVAPTALTISAADAKPSSTKTVKTVKAQTKQLLKDVAGKDKRLARLATAHSVVALADDTEAELVANIAEARGTLADVRTAVEAADSTVDTRAARKELRSFRVENFRLVVNVLKQVEDLTDDAAADAEAQAFLTKAQAAALAVTATSTKTDIKAARALLDSAKAELEAEEPVEQPAG